MHLCVSIYTRECGSARIDGYSSDAIQKSMGMVPPLLRYFLKIETGLQLHRSHDEQINIENPLHLSTSRSITF